jgi:hypothetical protein
MPRAFAVACALPWALGLITSETLGGFVYVVVGLSVVLLLVRIIQGPGYGAPGFADNWGV